MKVFRIISIIVLALTMSGLSYAQDLNAMLEKVQEDAASAFVTLEYTAEIEGADGVVKDKGVIEAQDKMWHIKGTLLEIYTDADGTWILDNAAKEAYVEPAWSYDDLRTFYASVVSAGSTLKVKSLNTTISDKKPAGCFTPILSTDWLITDLR